MIHVRAPLRISFMGGGSDLPAFYRTQTGSVISATIDKFVHVVINSTPLINKLTVKYQKTESVATPEELQHPSVRAMLLDLGIRDTGLEIGSFADLPSKTGLGSSSSFAVALAKGLNRYLGRRISPYEAAALASRVEIDLLGEPIGKQDQFAAAYGGFNVLYFKPDETVEVRPVLLGFKERGLLEDHSLLFFTGVSGDARSVLAAQSNSVAEKFSAYQQMMALIPPFEEALHAGAMEQLGALLAEGWRIKKSLSTDISSSLFDDLYQSAIEGGAYGGKLLGAGGRGCLYFIAPPEKHDAIRIAVGHIAEREPLSGFTEVPFRFFQSGADVLLDSRYHKNLN